MALVTLTRQTETIQGYQLTAPADMQAALAYIGNITGIAYSGTIAMHNTAGTLTWQLMINNQTNNVSHTAKIGDWLILENNSIVSVCPQANYAALYHT